MSDLNDRVHLSAYVDPALKRDIIRLAKKESRGNKSAMTEKLLKEAIEARKVK